MVSFCKEGTGRLVVINLEREDLLLESIRDTLAEYGIKDAVITSAIGSLSRVVLHRVTGFQPEPVDEFVTLEKPMELASPFPHGGFRSGTGLYGASGGRNHRALSGGDFPPGTEERRSCPRSG
ncbi:MAG: DNA-binding protein [Treponema sp.]|nr:DNA-binding protein [Treponema sp.]